VPRRQRTDAKDWIKAVRKALGVSQEKFGELVGADGGRDTVAKWENGYREPGYGYIQRIREIAPEGLRDFSGGNGMSDPSARLASIRKHLGEALDRRADKLTGPQALAIRSEIDDLSARIGSGQIDLAEADIIVDLLARIVGPGGRGDRR
jgi:transcriptional regulator with XRE-family HTH domain